MQVKIILSEHKPCGTPKASVVKLEQIWPMRRFVCNYFGYLLKSSHWSTIVQVGLFGRLSPLQMADLLKLRYLFSSE